MRAVWVSLLVLGLAEVSACHRSSGVYSKAAVEEAVAEHLKHRPGVVFENMTVEVSDVTFKGDTAEATVKLRSKQTPNLAVAVLYKLQRAGHGWRVESTSAATMPGASPHGEAPSAAPLPTAGPSDLAPQPSH